MGFLSVTCKHVCFIVAGGLWGNWITAAEPVDSIADRELGEVVVKADNVRVENGCQVLILGKANRDFGTNALDAISSLNRFQASLNETRLTSWDNQDVFVLINGVPSTAVDLRSYRADDIRRVEFYQNAPAQYLPFTSGPLVNVITRRRIDRLYSAYINARNAVNAGYGTDQLDLTYADSLNQVKAGYMADYRIFHGTGYHSEYIYSPTLRTIYDGNGRHRWVNQQANLSYQRFQGHHLFNAKVSLNSDPATEENNTRSLVLEADGTLSGESGSELRSDATTVAADLYYAYTFAGGGMLAANVSNSFGTSSSDSRFSLTLPPPYAGGSQIIASSVDNHTYTLNATALFMTPFKGGTLSVVNAYTFNRLRQNSGAGAEAFPQTHSNFLNAGYARRVGVFTLNTSLGARLYSQNTSAMSLTRVDPYARIYTDWWGSGKLSGLTAQLTFSLFTRSPRLGDLAASPSWLDRWCLSTGNPALDSNSLETSVRLILGYFSPDGVNRATVSVSPVYRHNPFVPVLVPGDGVEILQPRHISSVFGNILAINANWAFFPRFEVGPYLELYTDRYDTPSQRVRSTYLRGGGRVKYSAGRFEAVAAINSPTKVFNGDLIEESGLQWALSVQYKYRNWSFGAWLNYVGGGNSTSGQGGSFIVSEPSVSHPAALSSQFSYVERKEYHPRCIACLSLTYYFSKGRVRNHGQRILEPSGADNGLTDQNTAKPKM